MVQKRSGIVARTARRVLRTTVPDPFSWNPRCGPARAYAAATYTRGQTLEKTPGNYDNPPQTATRKTPFRAATALRMSFGRRDIRSEPRAFGESKRVAIVREPETPRHFGRCSLSPVGIHSGLITTLRGRDHQARRKGAAQHCPPAPLAWHIRCFREKPRKNVFPDNQNVEHNRLGRQGRQGRQQKNATRRNSNPCKAVAAGRHFAPTHACARSSSAFTSYGAIVHTDFGARSGGGLSSR